MMLLPKMKIWSISLEWGRHPESPMPMVKHTANQRGQVDEIQISFAAFRCPAPAPGLLVPNIQTRYGADRLDTIESIRIFDGVNLNKA
jgi:hypothetical protein